MRKFYGVFMMIVFFTTVMQIVTKQFINPENVKEVCSYGGFIIGLAIALFMYVEKPISYKWRVAVECCPVTWYTVWGCSDIFIGCFQLIMSSELSYISKIALTMGDCIGFLALYALLWKIKPLKNAMITELQACGAIN